MTLPATRLSNNAQGGAAEMVEGRRPAKGNMTSETRPGHGAGPGARSELGRVRRVAATDKGARFTALLHHVDIDRLRMAYGALKPKIVQRALVEVLNASTSRTSWAFPTGSGGDVHRIMRWMRSRLLIWSFGISVAREHLRALRS